MAARLMDISPDLVLSAAWLTARVVFLGTFGLFLVTQGNPRELHGAVRILDYLNAAPPTTVFRWRKTAGYEVVVYNTATDEEEVKPALFRPVRWSPTYLLWPKKGPQPKEVMVRRALLSFLARLFFFGCFFVGSFCLLGWLAVTESGHWFVAMGVLAVHQFVFFRAHLYFVWLRGWLFVVVGLGTWVYLQGGVLETVAVCAVGALVTIAVLGQWYMATSRRFQHMRDLGTGPFDPSRRSRPW
ncbi:hypothetical protein V1L54_03735 [Streptomyces sp. TRM 70361]|uniref:hypothetical protein n=1 Tax=Streptomyces sp. TRM 70361 TaxID=3116553 RepID=UPI002E7AE621|nr:hypothetical protein [Streptomyces sp. TRM 70361]MEE1938531.1 hypothetical protein [Streptomyces sp. TRM 70361]